MKDIPTSLSYIKHVRPYIPGKPIEELARERNIDPEKIIKLASNENPLGVSPKAARVLQLIDGSRYPEQHDLVTSLARIHTLPSSSFIIGNGSNEIIDLIARTYLAPGLNAVTSEFSFVAYGLSVMLTGANHIVVPARDYACDPDAMLAAIDATTRVIWIANPNNPTGTLIKKDILESFLKSVPKHVLIVLDEAYYEYLAPEMRTDPAELLSTLENLIILRTFSKIYGLAGLRVGYGMSSPRIVSELNRVRMPFNVSSPALGAAAAALDDDDFVQKSFLLNKEMRQVFLGELDQLGISYLPSYGNFVTANFGDKTLMLYDKLLSRGIIVRPLQSYQMEQFLRITLGKPEEMNALVAALRELLR